MKVKVSDLIFRRLVERHGVRRCFLVTGGGAMHLDDSIGHTPGLSYTCNHHEQASAMAAEGYYRACGQLAVTCVTTGPGGTNAVTGVLGQWLDSIPGVYVSGQIKTSTYKHSYPWLPLRQLGDQEADIVSIVKPITKYATTVYDARDIELEVDRAVAIALDGRPGPVWLDIPLDVQGAYVEEAELRHWDPAELRDPVKHELVDRQLEELLRRLREAKSPLLYVGNGLRLAGRAEQFVTLAERLGAPVVEAISGSDLLPCDHPLFRGKPGICGDRQGNVAVQNADLLLILGTRLSIRQVSYAYEKIAPRAYKVMVDIDEAEMRKPTLSIDMPIHCHLAEFVDKMLAATAAWRAPEAYAKWVAWTRDVASRLPGLLDDNPPEDGYTSSYAFAQELFAQLQAGDVVVTGNGTAYTSTFQAMRVPGGVRVFANQGCAAMGYDLPAGLGAATAQTERHGGRTILVTGDGSLQMNLQELQTLVSYKLPLKVFVLENDGYLAIKTTQKAFFGGHFTGSDSTSGVRCPDLAKIAAAYGLDYRSCSSNGPALRQAIAETLDAQGAQICELHMPPEQSLLPKCASRLDERTGRMESEPLDHMAPFCEADVLYRP